MVPKPALNKLLCLTVKENIRKRGLEVVKERQEMSDDRSLSEELRRCTRRFVDNSKFILPSWWDKRVMYVLLSVNYPFFPSWLYLIDPEQNVNTKNSREAKPGIRPNRYRTDTEPRWCALYVFWHVVYILSVCMCVCVCSGCNFVMCVRDSAGSLPPLKEDWQKFKDYCICLITHDVNFLFL